MKKIVNVARNMGDMRASTHTTGLLLGPIDPPIHGYIHEFSHIFRDFIGFYTVDFGLVTLKMTCDAEMPISFDPVCQIF